MYQATNPGLTAQRNTAIRAGRCDIVRFVDDDTVLDSRYIESILREFAADLDGTVLGVGGSDHQLPSPPCPDCQRPCSCSTARERDECCPRDGTHWSLTYCR